MATHKVALTSREIQHFFQLPRHRKVTKHSQHFLALSWQPDHSQENHQVRIFGEAGIIIPKRIIHKAVDRNQIKRILRQAIDQWPSEPMHVLFIAKPKLKQLLLPPQTFEETCEHSSSFGSLSLFKREYKSVISQEISSFKSFCQQTLS